MGRRELDPRGAQRLATDAGPLAGLNECAFNPLCVCGRGSSAPTRVCSDAQICLLSWVSFGLEPASDGSGRRTHLLRHDDSRTTTTPSTSTVTSGTECRPHQRPARCRRVRICAAGRPSPAWADAPTPTLGSTLARQWRFLFAPAGTQPGRARGLHSWRGRTAPRPPERSHHLTTATGPRRPPGQGHVTPDRRGRPTHRLRPVAARYLRWPTGRGCSSPVIAGGCHLTVSRPVGRAVPATVIRAGVHVLGAARSPTAGDCHLTVSRPAGRAVPAMAIRAGRVTPTAGGCHHTVSTSLPPTTAGQSAAFPRTLRARARSRAGLIRRHYHGRHCSPASRPHHHVTSGPGPADGPEPARAALLSQPAGRSQPALPTTVSVRPASGRQQTGRCGVLTRIRVGAARPQVRDVST